jgi:hypothetical protein
MIVIRAGMALAFGAVVAIGAAGDWYEPGHEWLMPLAVVGVGTAIGRWSALWLALLPVVFALPNGTSGDPPAVPAAMGLAILGAGLLALGVCASKASGAVARSALSRNRG